MNFGKGFSSGKLLRVFADIILVNLAFVVALATRFFWLIYTEDYGLNSESAAQVADRFLLIFLRNTLPITIISIAVFALFGFYTRGRSYYSRYKLLVVAQAVSLAYLLFGFLTYFLDGTLGLPRIALITGWILTMLSLGLVRVWINLWRHLTAVEKQLIAPEDRVTNSVLVIGGAGYIGSALLPKLLNKGYKVRLLDLLLYGTEPIDQYLEHPNLEIVKADFRQVDQVVDAMRGIDAVIHLGALVGDPACAIDEELTIDINLMATRMIAEVAKGCGVSRFIFASTCSVYGAGDEILDEHSSLNPVSLYARSKIASEKVLAELADRNFVTTILRFGTIYGFSGRTRFDLVINLLTAKALVDKQITVFGGEQWRPFVHVDDASLAVFKALEAPVSVVRGQVYNVGSNEQNHTIQQIGELIHRHVPSAELLNMGSDVDLRNYRVNFDKIRNQLGFQPQWTIEAGIKQVSDAIKLGIIQEYTASEYSNAKFLKDKGLSVLGNYSQNWAHELIQTIDSTEESQTTNVDETSDSTQFNANVPARVEVVSLAS